MSFLKICEKSVSFFEKVICSRLKCQEYIHNLQPHFQQLIRVEDEKHDRSLSTAANYRGTVTSDQNLTSIDEKPFVSMNL